jgi:hypothetical protein
MAYKQHFIEWFSGKQLPSYWTTRNKIGTGTFAMADEVDGGYKITVQATASGQSSADFNNKRQYSPTSSVFIYVAKDYKVGSAGGFEVGFHNNTTGFGSLNSCGIGGDLGTPALMARSADASTFSQTAMSSTYDTSWHTFKTVLGSSDLKYYVDEVLDVTKTTNRPTAKMQPTFGVGTGSSSINPQAIGVRYMECYNT